jgi:hypothetical protein
MILTINRPINLHRLHRHLILARLPLCRPRKRRPTWTLPTSPGTSRFRLRKRQLLHPHRHRLLRPGVVLLQTGPIGVPAMPVAGVSLLLRKLLKRSRHQPPRRKTIPGLLRSALPAAMPGAQTQTVGNKASPPLLKMQSQTAGRLLRNRRRHGVSLVLKIQIQAPMLPRRHPRHLRKNPHQQPLAPGERKVVLAVRGGKLPRNRMTVGGLLRPDSRAVAGVNPPAETPGAVSRAKHLSRNSRHRLQRLRSKRHQQQNQPLTPGR